VSNTVGKNEDCFAPQRAKSTIVYSTTDTQKLKEKGRRSDRNNTTNHLFRERENPKLKKHDAQVKA